MVTLAILITIHCIKFLFVIISILVILLWVILKPLIVALPGVVINLIYIEQLVWINITLNCGPAPSTYWYGIVHVCS